MSLLFTIFTSLIPTRLTKVFKLASDGKLAKATSAYMCKGTAQRMRVAGLGELAEQLDALTSDQAVSWGIAGVDEANIVPQEDDPGTDPTRISRTRRNFSYPKGPGILMLDHDGTPDGELDVDELRSYLFEAIPALSQAPMLWRPSASAGLVAPDGCQLTGLHRHRLYIPVTDASGIPEAGKRIARQLWAAGEGWHEVGNAGQALQRCLVDTSVWQPERLDFAAPPILQDGIFRPNVTPRIFGDGNALFDLSQLASGGDDKAAFKRTQDSLKAIRPKCRAQRELWVAQRAPVLAQARGISIEKARVVLTRASEHMVLMGDFLLTAADGSTITVGDVLDNPDRWHNARFADPLDPDEDRRVAVVNLKGGARPRLYSHRHGGVGFELMRQSARVQLGRGMRVVATDAVLEVMRTRGDMFDFGEGALAFVVGGRVRPVTQDWLTDHMGRVCDFYSARSRIGPEGEEIIEMPDDAPAAIARAVLAKNGQRGFKKLVAVVTAPTLRIDGSVLDVPGFDESSGLLYYTDHPNPPRVPVAPTPADALDAVRFLWQPFAKFPLGDDVGRGVVMHGLLTAVLRAALPTAPGLAFDAPAPGSGKTLLAQTIGMLATGTEPPVLPPADNDEETRKRLFAVLREGTRVILWDNVREPLGNAPLDAFLTASTFADRILGSSESATLPNRAMFIATGNNLRLTGDTCRRIFVARLDAQTDRPYARIFDFNPLQVVAANRLAYAVAALTVVRAFIQAGSPRHGEGRTASFDLWDDLVRQPICWLATIIKEAPGPDLPALDDPLKAAERAFEQDPLTVKHLALLQAWHAVFPGTAATVARAVAMSENHELLRAALDEIGGQGATINTRRVGRWIEGFVDRRIKDFWFERSKLLTGVQTWIVKRSAPASQIQPSKDTKPTSVAAHSTIDAGELGGFGGSGGPIHDRGGMQISRIASVEAGHRLPIASVARSKRTINGQKGTAK